LAYATLDELKGRLDWTLDADEERIATSALEDASDLAAHYGIEWAEGSEPRLVRTLVLKAAARYMRNPGGYTQSRAGDETLAWNDDAGENAGTVYFTDEEQKLLSSLGGQKPGIYSVGVYAWNPRTTPGTGYVPVDNGGSSFPFFAEGYE
jgi:hypothetical protein